jgi:hypothetical protein
MSHHTFSLPALIVLTALAFAVGRVYLCAAARRAQLEAPRRRGRERTAVDGDPQGCCGVAAMTRRIPRRLRALWHRRELRWALDYLGLANLAELDALLARPLTAAEERFCATRERIMTRRNPVQLAREEIEGERLRRVVEAVNR